MKPSDFALSQRVRFVCGGVAFTGRVISASETLVRVAADVNFAPSLCTFDAEEIVTYRLEPL